MRNTVKALFFLVLVMTVVFSIAGCYQGKGSEATSTTAPNSAVLQPTGTVEGHMMDAVTDQPIVNAVIDIGVGSAVTGPDGVFVIFNVPCTTDSLNGTVSGVYRATIDMRNVSSPVSMGTNTTPRYADFVYFDTVNVKYTSLNDSEGSNPGGGAGTNHDTPVTGLVGTVDFMVGKLAANINGIAAFASTLQPVLAGYTVKLISTTAHGNSGGGTTGGTGNAGNIVMTTTTDVNGAFSFTNVESLQTFAISAQSADGLYKSNAYTILAPADGQTKSMNIQSGVSPATANVFTVAAVMIVPTDNVRPVVISVTPEKGADLGTVSSTTVTFTFSETMLTNAYANILTSEQVFTSTVGGVYDDVAVNYIFTKSSNIAHSVAWSADRKSLGVTIPNLAPSSIYSVDISAATGTNKLQDIYGNTLDPASPFLNTRFTTSNAPTAAAVANLSCINSASINAVNGPGTKTPTLDWAPVAGAKRYNVYRQTIQTWGALTEVGAPYTNVTPTGTTGSFFQDGSVNFVENGEIQLTYKYIVRSVNSDAVESADSNVVTVADVLSPRMNTVPATFIADISNGDNQVTINFNEPMRESSITPPGNWIISGLSGTTNSVTAARYDSVNNVAVLTLANPLSAANVMRTVIRTGADGVLNSVLNLANTDAYRIPQGQGGLCISPGNANGTLATAAAVGGDFRVPNRATVNAPPVGIYADTTNVCRTTATAPDTQVVLVGNSPATNQDGISAATYAVGAGTGGGAIQSAATDFTMESSLSGDDTLGRLILVTCTGCLDVAGNAIDGAFDQEATDGNIQ